MKEEEIVSAAHLIQAAKLGNTKAESILRTGEKVAHRGKHFHDCILGDTEMVAHCNTTNSLYMLRPSQYRNY